MHIKTTADILNDIDFVSLDFRERHILQVMIEMSFKTRLILISELNGMLYKEFTLTSVAYYLIKLRDKGFVDRHLINGVYCYEAIPFTERIPCI